MQTLQREEDLLTSSQSKGMGLPGSDGNSAMVKSCWHLLYVCFLGVGNGLEQNGQGIAPQSTTLGR